jgi:hypothetical protein
MTKEINKEAIATIIEMPSSPSYHKGELYNVVRVDILDWHGISKEFQAIINRGYEVIYPAGSTA